MILLDMKNSKTASSPLGLSTSKEKPLLSFSDLLKSAGDKKELKTTQNSSMAVTVDTQEKSLKTPKMTQKVETPVSVLKVNEKILKDDEAELVELNPKLTSALSSADLKTLITDAKNYLKEKIQNSDGYKNAEIKELPKTLNGLVEVAKKMGIDINKISFEEVKQTSLTQSQTQNSTLNLQEEIPQDTDTHLSKESLAEKKVSLHMQNQKQEQPQKSQEIEPKSEKNSIVPLDAKESTPLKVQTEQTAMQQIVQKTDSVLKPESVQELPNKQEHALKQELPLKVQETPLFKAQSEHVATEQLVQAKANNLSKPEHKQIKEKSEDPLTLLLSDEYNTASPSTPLTQESLAVALKTTSTASSSVAQEGIKTLEQLLQGTSSSGEQSQTTLKTEAFAVHKADSLEVKMNEAKQMIRYLSDDIKHSIDEYKSPFTRVKVQLNPQHLGEVDLTVVQRGKNLHVNITSNNTAINTLAMNVNELRVQLSNSGINNATFHFNDGSQQSFTDSGNAKQQQNNQRKAHEEYNYFEGEEANEEILSSLEIVVPQYI